MVLLRIFFAVNADINYYIVSNSSRSFWDVYAIAGAGAYNAFDAFSGIVYPGLGINYWFSNHLGLNLTGKANLDVTSRVPKVNNYYSYTIGLIWRPEQGMRSNCCSK